jgi:hypothetical protein
MACLEVGDDDDVGKGTTLSVLNYYIYKRV